MPSLSGRGSLDIVGRGLDMSKFYLLALGCTLSLGGCAGLPSLPQESELPVALILRSTVCDLYSSFRQLPNRPDQGFVAEEWAAAIKLQPKIEQSMGGAIGASGRTGSVADYFSWVFGVGAASGLGAEFKGSRTATTTHSVHMYDLLRDTPSQECGKPQYVAGQELTKAHGLLPYMQQILSYKNSNVSLQDFSFTAEVFSKFDSSAGISFVALRGSGGPAISGYRSTDVTVTISFTDDAKHAAMRRIVTQKKELIPPDATISNDPNNKDRRKRYRTIRQVRTVREPPPRGVSPSAMQRLQMLQFQQSLDRLSR